MRSARRRIRSLTFADGRELVSAQCLHFCESVSRQCPNLFTFVDAREMVSGPCPVSAQRPAGGLLQYPA